MEKYLELGKIINKRGIKGEMKIEPYTNSIEDFLELSEIFLDNMGIDARRIESCKFYRDFVYIKISGINTPEEADCLRGKLLYVDRDDIDISDSEVFISDIIGLDVIDADTGCIYGKVCDVIFGSRYNTYVIAGNGREYMLPDVDEFIDRIEENVGMFVTPIPGLFDSAEEIK